MTAPAPTSSSSVMPWRTLAAVATIAVAVALTATLTSRANPSPAARPVKKDAESNHQQDISNKDADEQPAKELEAPAPVTVADSAVELPPAVHVDNVPSMTHADLTMIDIAAATDSITGDGSNDNSHPGSENACEHVESPKEIEPPTVETNSTALDANTTSDLDAPPSPPPSAPCSPQSVAKRQPKNLNPIVQSSEALSMPLKRISIDKIDALERQCQERLTALIQSDQDKVRDWKALAKRINSVKIPSKSTLAHLLISPPDSSSLTLPNINSDQNNQTSSPSTPSTPEASRETTIDAPEPVQQETEPKNEVSSNKTESVASNDNTSQSNSDISSNSGTKFVKPSASVLRRARQYETKLHLSHDEASTNNIPADHKRLSIDASTLASETFIAEDHVTNETMAKREFELVRQRIMKRHSSSASTASH